MCQFKGTNGKATHLLYKNTYIIQKPSFRPHSATLEVYCLDKLDDHSPTNGDSHTLAKQ